MVTEAPGDSMIVRFFSRLGMKRLNRWVARMPGLESGFDTKARAQYQALIRQATWPRNPVLRWHLAGYVLPGVVLYVGLQETGWSADQAVGVVGDALESDTQRRRRRMERRGRHRGFFVALAFIVRVLTRVVYPPPGWQVEWLEVSRQRVAFDMTGCFYLDQLTRLGARELTPVYCRVDDLLYEGVSPELAWHRSTLLATGGERCDFRFERRSRMSTALR